LAHPTLPEAWVAPGCSCPASYRQAYEIRFGLSPLVLVFVLFVFFAAVLFLLLTTITVALNDRFVAIDERSYHSFECPQGSKNDDETAERKLFDE